MPRGGAEEGAGPYTRGLPRASTCCGCSSGRASEARSSAKRAASAFSASVDTDVHSGGHDRQHSALVAQIDHAEFLHLQRGSARTHAPYCDR